MKFINIKRFALKAFTIGVLSTIIVTGSMVTLASSNRPVGELLVNGKQVVENGAVTVNGEAAKSGRTIFSGSTIATSENLSATINLGKVGKLELAPGTIFTLNVNSDSVSGSLTSGSVTVVNSDETVGVVTLTGELVTLHSGESVDAHSSHPSQQTKNTGKVVLPIIGAVSIWALIAVSAAVVIGTVAIVAAANDNDKESSVVSPVR
ncbi:MAG: hypothetical protein ABIV48_09835 [Pyrinomonadaceae bacterium]